MITPILIKLTWRRWVLWPLLQGSCRPSLFTVLSLKLWINSGTSKLVFYPTLKNDLIVNLTGDIGNMELQANNVIKQQTGWCTDWSVLSHRGSRRLYILQRLSPQRAQGFILQQEQLLFLGRLPDVLLAVSHKHHFLSTEEQITSGAAAVTCSCVTPGWQMSK